jgi:molecular chaperone GrpE (heat shock protein)
LQKLWVEPFISVWEKVDPNKHNVMTLLPWKPDIIIEEFEKWYLLWDRVLRHSKVVAGSLE